MKPSDDSETRPRRFPNGSRVSAVRIARPTSRLDLLVRFYRDDLGLAELGRFSGHQGYDGVMLGLPDRSLQLELTQSDADTDLPHPHPDNLLVLYLPDAEELKAWQERMMECGHGPVVSENPYWDRFGLTFEDPDGWRVVLCAPPT